MCSVLACKLRLLVWVCYIVLSHIACVCGVCVSHGKRGASEYVFVTIIVVWFNYNYSTYERSRTGWFYVGCFCV